MKHRASIAVAALIAFGLSAEPSRGRPFESPKFQSHAAAAEVDESRAWVQTSVILNPLERVPPPDTTVSSQGHGHFATELRADRLPHADVRVTWNKKSLGRLQRFEPGAMINLEVTVRAEIVGNKTRGGGIRAAAILLRDGLWDGHEIVARASCSPTRENPENCTPPDEVTATTQNCPAPEGAPVCFDITFPTVGDKFQFTVTMLGCGACNVQYTYERVFSPEKSCAGFPVTIDGNDLGCDPDGICFIVGTDRRDVIKGTPFQDSIDARAGDDIVCAGDEQDIVFGGDGRDRLLGERGDDLLYGDRRKDVVRGGRGDDFIEGGRWRDRLMGGRGMDEIQGNENSDRLRGGPGDDELFGGFLDDEPLDDAESDPTARDTGDSLVGGPGQDNLYGGHGDDVLLGGAGADELHGGPDDDVLFGGPDSDTLIPGTGNDEIHQ